MNIVVKNIDSTIQIVGLVICDDDLGIITSSWDTNGTDAELEELNDCASVLTVNLAVFFVLPVVFSESGSESGIELVSG